MLTQQSTVMASLPSIGLGTFKVKDPQTIYDTIETALASGYKLIDTAAVYKNEEEIGRALAHLCPKYDLNPEQIAVTSKLAPCDHGYESAIAACEHSLVALGRSSLDFYLIHWPGASGRKREDSQNAVLRRESWRALEELKRRGKVKAIGVSNYTIEHIEELLQYSSMKPSVLQVAGHKCCLAIFLLVSTAVLADKQLHYLACSILQQLLSFDLSGEPSNSECHPLLTQVELRKYCLGHGIHFQAYSSLGTGELLQNNFIECVARRCGRTSAQVLLRWAIQQGIGVIPKSCNVKHVRENAAIFDFAISAKDMELLNSLDAAQHYCWDPRGVA